MINRIFHIIAFLLLSINTLFAGVATVSAVSGNVYINRGGKNIKIKIGDTIEKKDIITSRQNGRAQIIFKDNTIVTIGKNSNFSIKDYFYDSSKKSKLFLNLNKGIFRTISGKIGKIAKERFKLKTRNATIGIRGTAIYIEASPKFGDKIACTKGAIEVTSNFTGKSVVVPAGKLTQVKPNSSPTPPTKIKQGDIKKEDKKKESKKGKKTSSKKEKVSNTKKKSKKVSSKSTTKREKSSDTDKKSKEKVNNTSAKSKSKIVSKDKVIAKSKQNREIDTASSKKATPISNTDKKSEEAIMATKQDEQKPTNANEQVNQRTTTSEDSTIVANDEAPKESSTPIGDTTTNDTLSSNIETISKSVEDTTNTQNDTAKEEEVKVVTKPKVTLPTPPNISLDTTNDIIDIPFISNSSDASNDLKDETVYEDSYLSFGYWADSDYKPTNTWIYGTATPSDIVDDYITHQVTASYEGDVIAIVDGEKASGNFNMDFDFSSQTFSADISFQAQDKPVWKIGVSNGVVTPYGFQSDSITTKSESDIKNITGHIEGGFYGPSAESIGGKFILNGGNSEKAKGVFGGVKK